MVGGKKHNVVYWKTNGKIMGEILMYFVLSPRGFTYGGEYSRASIAYFLSCNLVVSLQNTC